jgi:SAM-dependent methyltransferase
MDLDEYRRMAEVGETHWWYRSVRALLQQLIVPELGPVTAETRYLDAAGGTGATGAWLADRAPTALDDFEQVALTSARGSFAGYLPARADLNQLPHPADSFDAVLCVTALCHRFNTDPQVGVREFARVTKPGGLVCLMEPGVRRLRRSHDDVTHTGRRFSVSDLRGLLVGAGVQPLRCTGAFTFLIPPAAVLGVLRRNSGDSDLDTSSSGLHGLLGGLAAIERKLLTKVSLPFGLSVLAIGRVG